MQPKTGRFRLKRGLTRNRTFQVGLVLTGLIMLSYHVLIRYTDDGIWDENLWIKAAIYTPFYGLLLADGWQTWQSRRGQSFA